MGGRTWSGTSGRRFAEQLGGAETEPAVTRTTDPRQGAAVVVLTCGRAVGSLAFRAQVLLGHARAPSVGRTASLGVCSQTLGLRLARHARPRGSEEPDIWL